MFSPQAHPRRRPASMRAAVPAPPAMLPPAKLIHPMFSPQAMPERLPVPASMLTPASAPVVLVYAVPLAGEPEPRRIHPVFSAQTNPARMFPTRRAPWLAVGEPASRQFIHPQFSLHEYLCAGL